LGTLSLAYNPAKRNPIAGLRVGRVPFGPGTNTFNDKKINIIFSTCLLPGVLRNLRTRQQKRRQRTLGEGNLILYE
jgi:hypothetical protein